MVVYVIQVMRHNSKPVKASVVDIIIFIMSPIVRLKIQNQGGAIGKKIYFSILFVMSFGGGQRIALKGHRAKGILTR